MQPGTHTLLQNTFIGLEEDALQQLRHVAEAQQYKAGEIICRQGDGRFLGMLAGLELIEEVVKLQAGDRILFISDGVTDAVNRQGEQYGNERLTNALVKYGTLAAPDLIQHLAQDIAIWQQDVSPFDDLTMLVLEAEA